jgi:hypothetical protein
MLTLVNADVINEYSFSKCAHLSMLNPAPNVLRLAPANNFFYS